MAETMIALLIQPPAIVSQTEIATGQALAITQDEAVMLALKQNPDLLVAHALIDTANGRIAEAQANRRPAFTIGASATGFDRRQTANFALPGIPPISFTTATKDQSQALLTADLPIDLSGQIQNGIRSAKVGKEAAVVSLASVENRIVVQVSEAYYRALQAQELVKVAEEAVRNAEERERTAESYVRAGTATRFETLRAATQTADARQSLLVARNRVTLALAALANLLDVPQATRITLRNETKSAPPLASFEEASAEAEEKRPELLAAKLQVRAAEIAIRIAAGSDDPTFGVGAQYQHSPRPGFGQAKDLAAVSVKLTIPLYDRGISNARVKQARADLLAAQNTYLSARNSVTLDVRQEWLSRQEADDRLQVADAALTQAEEQYRIAQNRYRAGVNLRGDLSSPLLEISDAQNALTQAQTNAINARFDVLKSQSRLEGALGRYSRMEVKP